VKRLIWILLVIWVFFVGKYTLYSSENQEIDQGKYVSVLKNIDGKWKVHRDVYNSSMPLE